MITFRTNISINNFVSIVHFIADESCCCSRLLLLSFLSITTLGKRNWPAKSLLQFADSTLENEWCAEERHTFWRVVHTNDIDSLAVWRIVVVSRDRYPHLQKIWMPIDVFGECCVMDDILWFEENEWWEESKADRWRTDRQTHDSEIVSMSVSVRATGVILSYHQQTTYWSYHHDR